MPRTGCWPYARAHESFVVLLRDSGLPSTVVRPTGFFSVFGESLHMARKGRGILIGSGGARTNPVHEEDVAAVCVEALDRRLEHRDLVAPR